MSRYFKELTNYEQNRAISSGDKSYDILHQIQMAIIDKREDKRTISEERWLKAINDLFFQISKPYE